MVEDSEMVGDDVVRLPSSVARAAVRPAGDDVRLVKSCCLGTFITPPVLGVLAMVNALTVLVYPRVRAAVHRPATNSSMMVVLLSG